MSRWLQNFAYRIDIEPVHFIGSAAFALLIAASTVSYQAFKAASRDSVTQLDSLIIACTSLDHNLLHLQCVL
jgi:putative ABC transport system permease protein